MKMNKVVVLLMVLCLLLAGCAYLHSDGAEETAPAVEPIPAATEPIGTVPVELPDDFRTITALPDTKMENLSDAILSVSLSEGDTYVDEDGNTQMNLKIYSYDRYDMVDIACLKIGDILVRHSGEIEVFSVEQKGSGRICINGGIENDGFDLMTDDSGIFYEIGFNDTKNWYQVGKATIRVSADFLGLDRADLDLGEVTIHADDFLNGVVTNYDFTPYNTTIRVENGQIVEMNRAYMP